MKKKLFYISSLLIVAIIIGGSGCPGDPVTTPPPSQSNYEAINLYTQDAGSTWSVNSISYYYHQDMKWRKIKGIQGVSSFSSDLSTYSIIADLYVILKTTNFGANWYSQDFVSDEVNGICNTGTGDKGFIVGGGTSSYGIIKTTTDNGESWSFVEQYGDHGFWAIDFGDEMQGIIIPVNPGDSTYLTDNGGSNWTKGTPITSSNYINDIRFTGSFNSTDAVVCGNYGEIFRTSNKGATWDSVTSPTNRDLNSIDFIGPVGIIVGNNGTILRSDDGGFFWQSLTHGNTNNLKKVYLTANEYWAVGDKIILKSTDQGQTWSTVHYAENEYYKDLIFIKSQGVVVGERQK